MDGGLSHWTGGSDQNQPKEKQMEESTKVAWRGLAISWEKKIIKRQRRKRKMYPTECKVPGCHCLLHWKHYTLLINVGKRTRLQNSRNFQIHDQQQLLIRKPNLIRGLFWWLGRLKEKESKGIGCDDIQWGYRETKCFYGDFTCPCICSLNLLLQFWEIEKLPLWTLGIPRSHKNMSIRNRARSLEEYAKDNYDKIVGETWSNPSHQHTLSLFFFFFCHTLRSPAATPGPYGILIPHSLMRDRTTPPALEYGVLTTELPGKSQTELLNISFCSVKRQVNLGS